MGNSPTRCRSSVNEASALASTGNNAGRNERNPPLMGGVNVQAPIQHLTRQTIGRFHTATGLLPLVTTALLVMLSGCSPIVATSPAAQANTVTCANVTVHLPDRVAGLARRETNAQATAAWGDPVSVLLRCGIRAPAASTLPCVGIGKVFWLQDKGMAHSDTYTSFGRNPAVAVTIDPSLVSAGTALGDLASGVELTPINGRQCLGGSDPTGQSRPSPLSAPEPTP